MNLENFKKSNRFHYKFMLFANGALKCPNSARVKPGRARVSQSWDNSEGSSGPLNKLGWSHPNLKYPNRLLNDYPKELLVQFQMGLSYRMWFYLTLITVNCSLVKFRKEWDAGIPQYVLHTIDLIFDLDPTISLSSREMKRSTTVGWLRHLAVWDHVMAFYFTW